MNRITLNARELQEVYDLFNQMNEFGTVTLESSNESGIGSILKATFTVTHKDVEGDFTVNITDESDW